MDIAGWLRELGLERYGPAFRENEIDAEMLPDLTESDRRSSGSSRADNGVEPTRSQNNTVSDRRSASAAVAEIGAGAAEGCSAGDDGSVPSRSAAIAFSSVRSLSAGPGSPSPCSPPLNRATLRSRYTPGATAGSGGSFVGTLDLTSGAITPVVTGLMNPDSLVFVDTSDPGNGLRTEGSLGP
jgi:hypothetical protein